MFFISTDETPEYGVGESDSMDWQVYYDGGEKTNFRRGLTERGLKRAGIAGSGDAPRQRALLDR
jgi:hypothetical protein